MTEIVWLEGLEYFLSGPLQDKFTNPCNRAISRALAEHLLPARAGLRWEHGIKVEEDAVHGFRKLSLQA